MDKKKTYRKYSSNFLASLDTNYSFNMEMDNAAS